MFVLHILVPPLALIEVDIGTKEYDNYSAHRAEIIEYFLIVFDKGYSEEIDRYGPEY